MATVALTEIRKFMLRRKETDAPEAAPEPAAG
jgi:hypothetical protein